MLTFEEFRKKNDWLPYKYQKDCYKWYLNGIREALNEVNLKFESKTQKGTFCGDCDYLAESIEAVNEELNENLEDVKE